MPKVKDKPKPPTKEWTQDYYRGGIGYQTEWYTTNTYKWGGPKLQVGKPRQGPAQEVTFATVRYTEKDRNFAKEIISSGSIASNIPDHFICSRQLLLNTARFLLKTADKITTSQKMKLVTEVLKDPTLVLQVLQIPENNSITKGQTIVFKSRSQAFKKSLNSLEYCDAEIEV